MEVRRGKIYNGSQAKRGNTRVRLVTNSGRGFLQKSESEMSATILNLIMPREVLEPYQGEPEKRKSGQKIENKDCYFIGKSLISTF